MANSTTSPSPSEHSASMSTFIEITATALKEAAGSPKALEAVVTQFFNEARAAGIAIEEIENTLGINEPSILDLANLSLEDEEIVIDAFEQLSST